MCTMGLIGFSYGKGILTNIMEHDLQNEVQNMVDKIIIIYYNTDSRDFQRNTSYFITNQKSDFVQRDLDSILFFLDEKQALVEDYWQFDFEYTALPQKLNDLMVSETKGVSHVTWMGKKYLIAYQRIIENDWTYVAAVEENQYLLPITKFGNKIYQLAGILGLLGIIIAFIGSLFITKPIARCIKTINHVSSGDLSARVCVDESVPELANLANSFNGMLSKLVIHFGSLNHSMKHLLDEGKNLSQLTEENIAFANTMGQFYEGIVKQANHQAGMTTQSRDVINKVGMELDKVKRNMDETNDASNKAIEVADKGRITIKEMDEKFQDILAIVNKTNNEISILTKRTDDITGFVKLISDIGSQTQLLALNASLEAARAGSAGRGFSVVSNEIKNLAQKVTEASTEIEKIVADVNIDVYKVKQSSLMAEDSVSDGKELMMRTDEAFKDIRNSVQKTHNEIDEMQASLDVMSSKIVSLTANLDQLECHSQEAMANTQHVEKMFVEQKKAVHKIKEASGSLFDIANNMQDFLNNYRYEKSS